MKYEDRYIKDCKIVYFTIFDYLEHNLGTANMSSGSYTLLPFHFFFYFPFLSLPSEKGKKNEKERQHNSHCSWPQTANERLNVQHVQGK